MPRPLLVLTLVWVPFLSIFGFAALGDSSYPHLAFHVVAVACLVAALVVLVRLRRTSGPLARGVALVVTATVAVAVLGHVAELATALDRFAADGFRNRDTSDLWEHGPHQRAADVTVPAMMASMVGTVVLAVAARSGRRRSTQAA